MAWPLASHFSAMLQTPKLAFRDPALQSCRVEKDAMNQPRPWSGSFAVVYKGISAEAGRAFAIRVFTTESPERRERYDRISEYLQSRKLACLVDFEYRDRAIRSAGDGKFYPVILMDWVQGDTLFNWVRARCAANDAAALGEAARRWLSTVKELADARVAHGDIQHANIMVTDAGDIRLVDYDGMCVPELVGRRNLEVGVEPYQHPDRNPTTLLSMDLDRYSSIVIYVALRALAAAPELWRRHVEQTGNDKLLFRKDDLSAPSGSALYADLKRSPEPDVRELIDQLVELTRVPMDQVPSLSRLANSFSQIEELLEQKQWEEAVRLLNRRGRFRDAPEELKPLIHEAYEYVLRTEAWRAFLTVPRDLNEQCDRELVRAWNEPLFAKMDEADALRPRVDAASQRILILKRIARTLRQSTGTATEVTERTLVGLAGRLPSGYLHSLQERVALARRRYVAMKRFREAVSAGTNEEAIESAWQSLVEAGCQDWVADPIARVRLEQAQTRVPLLKSLRSLSQQLAPELLDRQILTIWRAGALDGCTEADPWRPIYDRAVYRRNLLANLQSAIEQRNDPLIATLVADPVLEGYPLPAQWSVAIQGASKRATLGDALLDALRDGQRDQFTERFDARLIRAYAERFAPYGALIGEWVRDGVLGQPEVGLGLAVGRASIARLEDRRGAVRLRWTWPPPRIADECLLAVCPFVPAPTDTPSDVHALYRAPIDRSAWEDGGGSRVLEPQPEWIGHHVVVWAYVDLGFVSFYSQPLVLGVLEASRGWRSWLPFARSEQGSKSSGKPADQGSAAESFPSGERETPMEGTDG